MNNLSYLIYEHIPEESLHSGQLELLVTCNTISLPAGLTKEHIQELWLEKAAGKQDLERYFLEKINKPILVNEGDAPVALYSFEVALNNYAAFFAGNILLADQKKSGHLTITQLSEFFRTTHSILGLNVIVELADGLLYGARANFVTQGKGMLLPVAGGIMPDYYGDNKYRVCPFVSAKKQFEDETGYPVEIDAIKYLGIARDTAGSENPSLIFGIDLSSRFDSVGFMDYLRTATDKAEHKDWFVVPFSRAGLFEFLSGETEAFRSIKSGEEYFTYCSTVGSSTTGSSAAGSPKVPPEKLIRFMTVGFGAAALHARQKYGNDFFEECNLAIRKNPFVNAVFKGKTYCHEHLQTMCYDGVL